MIRIKKEIKEQIICHAKKEYPLEACGYLAARDGIIEKVFEMRNTDKSHEHFSMDPAEQFSILREVRRYGLTLAANYHSHPYTPSRPSEEDIRLANDPDMSYLIISLAEKDPVVKSFRIKNNKSEEEEIITIN